MSSKFRLVSSGLMISVLVGAVIGASSAFFSDTETSTGNTFTAGAIDLKVDSECHYYNYDPNNPDAIQGETPLNGYVEVGCTDETAEFGNWSESDLESGVHKFFNFTDIKPGDIGEDTISLHVYTNDAWGRLTIDNLTDLDVDCTEPESEDLDDPECITPTPTPGDGELQEALQFYVWLDQGSTPGFQNGDPGEPPVPEDSSEGDNLWQPLDEPVLINPGPINDPSETWNLWEGLSLVYANTPSCTVEDGHTDYGLCHGLAADGRMVGSTTYYFGVGWGLPPETGNEAQGDSFGGDMTFEVEQYRNNPVPFDGI